MRKYIAIGMVLLFATMMVEPSNAMFTKMKATIGFHEYSRDQVELRYYDPNTLGDVVGINGDTPPYVWKSAIRLTQTELAPYRTWNITQVVIGFGEDPSEGPMNVTIYIYAKGTATRPGSVIVKDTWAILNGTQLITVPLVTPVSLSVTGRDEVWVAVQWTQNTDLTHYAFVDDGPAVVGKGDWIYLNNIWQEIHNSIDSNWALGAVVKVDEFAPILIMDIRGPIGIKANLQTAVNADLHDVKWSIKVRGGVLGLVNKTATGTIALLPALVKFPISLPMFVGFGKISIIITANVTSFLDVTEIRIAFLFGPVVLGIR
jgi:hypothetical protein